MATHEKDERDERIERPRDKSATGEKRRKRENAPETRAVGPTWLTNRPLKTNERPKCPLISKFRRILVIFIVPTRS